MPDGTGSRLKFIFNELFAPRCRVFRVTGQSLANNLHDLLRCELEHRRTLHDAMRGTHPGGQRQWFAAKIDFGGQLARWIGWDNSVAFWCGSQGSPEYPYVPVQPTLTVRGQEFFIVVPRLDYYCNHPDRFIRHDRPVVNVNRKMSPLDNSLLIENMRKWTPPPSLEEVPNNLPGRNPKGMPEKDISRAKLANMGFIYKRIRDMSP